ncbi:MAG: hypothetical protein ABI164_01055 [Acidobacteriaceae bacterium]
MAFLIIGIIFFLAWLASFFFFVIGHIATYTLLFLAIISIIVHFILRYCRRSAERTQQ